MSIWITLPPWLFAVAITLVGRWGDRRFFRHTGVDEEHMTTGGAWITAGTILFANLFFLSLIPTIVLAISRCCPSSVCRRDWLWRSRLCFSASYLPDCSMPLIMAGTAPSG